MLWRTPGLAVVGKATPYNSADADTPRLITLDIISKTMKRTSAPGKLSNLAAWLSLCSDPRRTRRVSVITHLRRRRAICAHLAVRAQPAQPLLGYI
jgi:hypothetical protein